MKDVHHIVQDAAVRDIPGYDRGSAPAIQADGPSIQIGSERSITCYNRRDIWCRVYNRNGICKRKARCVGY